MATDKTFATFQEVTKECLLYTETLDCRFHNCLFERYPCGDDRRKAEAYAQCEKSRARANNLTESGKNWYYSITRCFVKKLINLYKRSSIVCPFIGIILMKTQKKCYIQNNFCTMGWTHREDLWYIFSEPLETAKSPHYRGMWKNIAKMARGCKTQEGEKFARWINTKLKTLKCF
ncbi:Hypothetical predicted protein [Octopus vulgaris]|uniref:Uncharacterized protein n=1 Tax=Octopus vulgaris TaxID=6645 RepID=A0AA36BJR4_OCTVU|nr:Hypothetical predicted protein [Octopus vulgaris]